WDTFHGWTRQFHKSLKVLRGGAVCVDKVLKIEGFRERRDPFVETSLGCGLPKGHDKLAAQRKLVLSSTGPTEHRAIHTGQIRKGLGIHSTKSLDGTTLKPSNNGGGRKSGVLLKEVVLGCRCDLADEGVQKLTFLSVEDGDLMGFHARLDKLWYQVMGDVARLPT